MMVCWCKEDSTLVLRLTFLNCLTTFYALRYVVFDLKISIPFLL